jgi:ParB-like chromosome segregation protein Spo0J
MTTKKKTKSKSKVAPQGSDFVRIDSIHPWKDNPRKNAHTVEKVAKAIKTLGWIRPIIANEHPRAKGEIIVGHTAHLAALSLGLEHVPVRWVKLPPAKAHAAALADNKLGEISTWDTDLLAAIAKQGVVGLDDLAVAGFTTEELERLGKPPSLPTGDFSETSTTRAVQFTCPKCKHKWRAKPSRKSARAAKKAAA